MKLHFPCFGSTVFAMSFSVYNILHSVHTTHCHGKKTSLRNVFSFFACGLRLLATRWVSEFIFHFQNIQQTGVYVWRAYILYMIQLFMICMLYNVHTDDVCNTIPNDVVKWSSNQSSIFTYEKKIESNHSVSREISSDKFPHDQHLFNYSNFGYKSLFVTIIGPV